MTNESLLKSKPKRVIGTTMVLTALIMFMSAATMVQVNGPTGAVVMTISLILLGSLAQMAIGEWEKNG